MGFCVFNRSLATRHTHHQGVCLEATRHAIQKIQTWRLRMARDDKSKNTKPTIICRQTVLI